MHLKSGKIKKIGVTFDGSGLIRGRLLYKKLAFVKLTLKNNQNNSIFKVQ